MERSVEEIVRAEFRSLLRKDIEGDIDDIPIAKLGIDSLDFFEKLIYLEEEFGIDIPINELTETVSLRTMIAALKK